MMDCGRVAAACQVARHQLFWEAFPSATGPADRTTYMFTYMDAEPWRPSLHALFEEYWELMPEYQVGYCQTWCSTACSP